MLENKKVIMYKPTCVDLCDNLANTDDIIRKISELAEKHWGASNIFSVAEDYQWPSINSFTNVESITKDLIDEMIAYYVDAYNRACQPEMSTSVEQYAVTKFRAY